MSPNPPPDPRRSPYRTALIGLSVQVLLALVLDDLSVRLWSGTEPFGRKWLEFVSIAAVSYLLQMLWLRSRRRIDRPLGNYLWVLIFWGLALIEIMAG